jgi:hypothetical protein
MEAPMKTKKSPLNLFAALSIFVLVLPILAGCGRVEAGAVQPVEKDPHTAETESSGIDLGEIGAIEAGIEPTPLPGRITYTNEVYGFAFDYPETWTLTEADHKIVLQKGTIQLGINFRRADEQIDPFGRTGIGAGDFIYAGKVSFINQVIPAEALFYDQKTKAVFYGKSGLVDIGDLVFVIALEDLETDYTKVNLPEEIIAEANTILESFKRIETASGS